MIRCPAVPFCFIPVPEFPDGKVLTNGGRVLAMTSFGDNITEAVEQSVYALEQLHFEGMYFRPDIGFEFREENATNGKA